MTFAGTATDEYGANSVCQQMRSLLFNDCKVQRAISLKRRVRGGE
jgi:hypothetical protein